MADLSPQMPRAGVDYPETFGQFQDWFSTDEACLEYLAGLRWPDGFVCPEVRRPRVLAHRCGPVDVQGVLPPHVGDGRDDLRAHPHPAENLVRRGVVDGTLHQGISREQLGYYLDEFTFRFNRRTSTSRGLLFYRLLQQATNTDPAPLKDLVIPREAEAPPGRSKR
ncbi:hypothetical protein GCM10027090_39730 [Sinomonas soli]